MMLFLMVFQNKRTLGAIIAHMSNKETYDKFNRRQTNIMRANYTLMALLFVTYPAIIYTLFKGNHQIYMDIFRIKNCSLLVYLNSVGLTMLYNLKSKYNFEY